MKNELKPFQQIETYFFLERKEIRKTKEGEDYLFLSLSDRDGTIGGYVWDNPREVATLIPERSIVKLTGITKKLYDSLVIHVRRVEPAHPDEIHLRDFVADLSDDNISQWTKKLFMLIKHIANPYCRSLLTSFLVDMEFVTEFIVAPGGKWIHHAYRGGLIEHTVSVMELALMTAQRHPHLVHKDLILTGAFIHDIGKTKELSGDNGRYVYSREGRLLGHIGIGHSMVKERISRIENFPYEIALPMEHMILSHHGYNEYGSPVRPATPEAVVLHLIDSYDARINHLGCLMRGIDPEREWSNFDKILGTAIYMKKIA